MNSSASDKERTRTWSGRRRRKLVATALCVAALAVTLYPLIVVLSGSPVSRVQFIPDDAFYYLTLARNFVHYGQWTFDSGVSLTSGFHPLHAYALAGIQAALHPSQEAFVVWAVLLSWFPAFLALLLGARFAMHRPSLTPALLLLLFAVSRNVSLNMVSGVEWGWVVLASVVMFRLAWGIHADPSPRRAALLFACCFAGVLARTDFGLVPAALVAATAPQALSPRGRRRLVVTMAGLTGAVAALALVLLHNDLATGQALQSSARMKALWLSIYGPSARILTAKVLGLFGESFWIAASGATILGAAALALGFRRFASRFASTLRGCASGAAARAPGARATVWFACLIAIVGYFVVYRLNPAALQNWYTANLVVPVFLFLALPRAAARRWKQLSAAITVVLVVLLAVQIGPSLRFDTHPEWPSQATMYRAGMFLHDRRLPGRVGSWNAGIVGYYSGGRVVNLDGLVNNDIFEYASRNRLPEYIDSVGIRFLAEAEETFEEEKRRRGGYDVEDFAKRLHYIRDFGDPRRMACVTALIEILPKEGALGEAKPEESMNRGERR